MLGRQDLSLMHALLQDMKNDVVVDKSGCGTLLHFADAREDNLVFVAGMYVPSLDSGVVSLPGGL